MCVCVLVIYKVIILRHIQRYIYYWSKLLKFCMNPVLFVIYLCFFLKLVIQYFNYSLEYVDVFVSLIFLFTNIFIYSQ